MIRTVGAFRMGLWMACALIIAFTYGVKDDVSLIQRRIVKLKAMIADEESLIADYEAAWAVKSSVPNLVKAGRAVLKDYEPLTAARFRRAEDFPLLNKNPAKNGDQP